MRSSSSSWIPQGFAVILLVLAACVMAGILVFGFLAIRVAIPVTQVAAAGTLQAMVTLPAMAWEATLQVLNSGSSEERKTLLIELDKVIRQTPKEQLGADFANVIIPPLQQCALDEDQEVQQLATELISFLETNMLAEETTEGQANVESPDTELLQDNISNGDTISNMEPSEQASANPDSAVSGATSTESVSEINESEDRATAGEPGNERDSSSVDQP